MVQRLPSLGREAIGGLVLNAMDKPWSLLGPKLTQPKPSWVFMVLAFLFAAETLIQFGESYPLYMTVLALGAGAWATYVGITKKAAIAFLFLPVASLWLNNLFGGDWFSTLNPISFFAHAVLAILFGIAGYSFGAWEKK